MPPVSITYLHLIFYYLHVCIKSTNSFGHSALQSSVYMRDYLQVFFTAETLNLSPSEMSQNNNLVQRSLE